MRRRYREDYDENPGEQDLIDGEYKTVKREADRVMNKFGTMERRFAKKYDMSEADVAKTLRRMFKDQMGF